MRTALLAGLLALAPMQVMALSCMPHSVEAAFGQAQAAQERYVIVQGQLDFSLSKVVNKRGKHNPNPATLMLDAQLTGHSLSKNGFVRRFAKPVKLLLECYGPWCGQATPRRPVLAFVELGAKYDVIRTNPCSGFLFERPSQEMLEVVQGCFAGKACTPPR